ncbi:MAG: glycosyltransferase family 2 protein [Flavisolibacter sp.]
MAELFSIVIICKNEANGIARVLESISKITDDIVVYDNGSTDGTIEIAKNYGVNVHQLEWLGFGKTKQKAVSLAKHNWVLSLDADEALDEQLQNELTRLNLSDPRIVYQIRFKNYLGNKYMKWGEWGGDKHIRLFNRDFVNWDDAKVHEQLVIGKDIKVEQLKGYILHHTMKDMIEYSNKMVQYALLNAEKYHQQGKKATWVKRHVNPVFSFINHYIFQLGFLDGWEGLVTARMTSFYTFLKYTRLHELNSRNKLS